LVEGYSFPGYDAFSFGNSITSQKTEVNVFDSVKTSHLV